ncbi:non-ribosomal peptide synthetase [Actinocorallia aurantiaca]|uniref:Carrier domain-containing protein n=1 Tax=Actinocorallia aurantiaca TaxID=46204 RepID=A0ABP6GEG9_9ACTN
MNRPGCAHQVFEYWAVRTPDRIAVSGPDGRITYRELDGRADALAAELRSRGVGPETVVGVVPDHPGQFPLAALAVWKAGGAYVPLGPRLPAGRVAAILAGGVRIVLAGADTAGVLAGFTGEVVSLTAAYRRSTGGREGTVPEAKNLAYVLFTSGSTGEPKGVLIEHAGVVNLAGALRRLYGDLEGSRVFQFAPPTFDAWVWELAMSLLNGGTLCVRADDAPLYGSALSDELRRCSATHLSASPSLLATLPVEDTPPAATLTAGGEALPESLVGRWGSKVRFFNAYGPTECTVGATAALCGDRPGPPPIGTPLEGVEVHVLDGRGRPAGEGETGEVYIGGAGVARGYLDLPSATAARFVPDHLSGRPGARLYRTGDLALRLPDGNLEFRGRADRQLKIRGYRIEPAEVEEALRRHPRVTGAVVGAHERPGMDRRLVAWVETAAGAPVTVDELRGFLRADKPDHLIPSIFVVLPRLPLTPHGKVDHTALPVPERARPLIGAGYVAPSGTTQDALARMWAELLLLDRVGADDDFSFLGGTSLDLLRLQEGVAARWGVRLSAAELLVARTVRLLAARLDGGPRRDRSPDEHADRRADRRTESLHLLRQRRLR